MWDGRPPSRDWRRLLEGVERRKRRRPRLDDEDEAPCSTGSSSYLLRSTRGLDEARLGLLEVDDVPDRLEVVGLDVLVLEVEGMLPDLV